MTLSEKKLFVLILHIWNFDLFEVFLSARKSMEKKKSQPQDGFAALVFSVSVFFHLHQEDTGLFRVFTP